MDIIRKVRLAPIIVFGTLFLSSCAVSRTKPVEFEVIPSQFQLAYQELGPQIFILKSQADLVKVMALLKMEAPEGIPDLSYYYQQHTVVLLYAGMQRTNGFMFGAESVVAKNQSLTITARLLQPDSDCMVSQVITHPFQMIAIEHQGGTDFSLDLVNAVRPCR